QEPGLPAERLEHGGVVLEEGRPGEGGEVGPGAVGGAPDPARSAGFAGFADMGEVDAALVRHLEEEKVGDLLDVVAVVDPVVAEGVAEAPEFLYQVAHAAMASQRVRWKRGSQADVW